MSELIDNVRRRKELLKHMILQLHNGEAPEQVRTQLAHLMGQVPYGDVVEVEQELIQEGLPTDEVLRLCDVHTEVLQGLVQIRQKPKAPPGHPAHTFSKENEALEWELKELGKAYGEVSAMQETADATAALAAIRGRFNALMDVDKHYQRKENLLFPFLERHGITGPPKVMWGKHDEARAFLKGAMETLLVTAQATVGEVKGVIQLVLEPASNAVAEMIDKEQQILLPMCLDTLTEAEWYEIARQSPEIGFCLFDPTEAWVPTGGVVEPKAGDEATARIQLPSGSFTAWELTTILNSIPFDLTFVDKDDTVRYFTQGRERIFSRTRAILGRKVQYCHPPSSVAIVDRILSDFRSGKENRAAFWINMKGRFIHIEYSALRDPAGEYLGCLEVSQDLTAKRALTGEQRLLSYGEEEPTHGN
jgi:uncharacterized protein